MSKRIVFCADGTWDSTTSNTNVYKLFKALTFLPGEQLPYYDDGVGTGGGFLKRILEGGAGEGLFRKIKDGYTYICHVHDPGDSIFLFGFSRGAYTARSLAGMIAVCGLPTRKLDSNLVETAFEAYRHPDKRQNLLASLAPYGMVEAPITMIGVWDTVGALGIPAIVGGVDPLRFGFLDTGLHPNVRNAYHAVAIDEHRAEFPATLWTSLVQPGQTVRQVYFCGAHGDVGGSYGADPDTHTALSDITLSWIISKARALGLAFLPEPDGGYPAPIDRKFALDRIHSSWSPLWLFPKHREIAAGATLANSVAIRCQTDRSYSPVNLRIENGMPAVYELESVV